MKSQERYRSEICSGGCGRKKTSRGWETLETQHDPGVVNPGVVAFRILMRCREKNPGEAWVRCGWIYTSVW